MENEVLMRCTFCYSEFTFEELKGTKDCPECGTTVPPHAIDQDILLYINWQELRALTIPAMQWYLENRDQIDDDAFNAIEAILDRINESKPDPEAEELTMDLLDEEEDEEIEIDSQALEKVNKHGKTLAEYQNLFSNRKKTAGLPN